MKRESLEDIKSDCRHVGHQYMNVCRRTNWNACAPGSSAEVSLDTLRDAQECARLRYQFDKIPRKDGRTCAAILDLRGTEGHRLAAERSLVQSIQCAEKYQDQKEQRASRKASRMTSEGPSASRPRSHQPPEKMYDFQDNNMFASLMEDFEPEKESEKEEEEKGTGPPSRRVVPATKRTAKKQPDLTAPKTRSQKEQEQWEKKLREFEESLEAQEREHFLNSALCRLDSFARGSLVTWPDSYTSHYRALQQAWREKDATKEDRAALLDAFLGYLYGPVEDAIKGDEDEVEKRQEFEDLRDHILSAWRQEHPMLEEEDESMGLAERFGRRMKLEDRAAPSLTQPAIFSDDLRTKITSCQVMFALFQDGFGRILDVSQNVFQFQMDAWTVQLILELLERARTRRTLGREAMIFRFVLNHLDDQKYQVPHWNAETDRVLGLFHGRRERDLRLYIGGRSADLSSPGYDIGFYREIFMKPGKATKEIVALKVDTWWPPEGPIVLEGLEVPRPLVPETEALAARVLDRFIAAERRRRENHDLVLEGGLVQDYVGVWINRDLDWPMCSEYVNIKRPASPAVIRAYREYVTTHDLEAIRVAELSWTRGGAPRISALFPMVARLGVVRDNSVDPDLTYQILLKQPVSNRDLVAVSTNDPSQRREFFLAGEPSPFSPESVEKAYQGMPPPTKKVPRGKGKSPSAISEMDDVQRKELERLAEEAAAELLSESPPKPKKGKSRK